MDFRTQRRSRSRDVAPGMYINGYQLLPLTCRGEMAGETAGGGGLVELIRVVFDRDNWAVSFPGSLRKAFERVRRNSPMFRRIYRNIHTQYNHLHTPHISHFTPTHTITPTPSYTSHHHSYNIAAIPHHSYTVSRVSNRGGGTIVSPPVDFSQIFRLRLNNY